MSGTLTTEGFKVGNEHYVTVFGGDSLLSSGFTCTVNLSAKTTGQVIHIEAIQNHWDSLNSDYTLVKKCGWMYTFSTTTNFAWEDDGNIHGGSLTGEFTINKPSNGQVRIVKSNGTRTWPGEWFVKVTTSCPATKG